MNLKNLDPQIKQLTQKIVGTYKPERIILFGSRAWGKPTSDSDADLLIIKQSDLPRGERERHLRRLLTPIGLPVDLMIYTPSELEKSINQNRNLFLEDITKNGLTLYAKD